MLSALALVAGAVDFPSIATSRQSHAQRRGGVFYKPVLNTPGPEGPSQRHSSWALPMPWFGSTSTEAYHRYAIWRTDRQ